ncbi:MAG: sigma-54-dependent transcriptional regulator, partial [Isosphaeraceae bacterium]
MNPLRILVVQPDPVLSSSMVSIMQTLGCRVEQAESDREAARMLDRFQFNAVVCIVEPDDPDVIELYQYIRRKFPHVFFAIQLTKSSESFQRQLLAEGVNSVSPPPMTVASMKSVVLTLRNRQEQHRIQAENETNGQASRPTAAVIPAETNYMVGHDPSLRKTIELAENVADIDTPVLILGDRGTGKTTLSRWVHQRGNRSAGVFTEVNCQNSSETALEAEIFGISAPGPNGAPIHKMGKLEEANNGTIVFDEPLSLSPTIQQKILRFLQTGEYQAVGSHQVRRSSARAIFSTREAISALAQRERFRQDLYYRISVIVLKLPPLCLRGNDIELLARHFLSIYARRLSKPVREFSHDALRVVCDHGWPGNVYELESVIHRGVILSQNGVVQPQHLVMMPVA